MNILLSSVGRRGYLVKYFKEALGSDGQVWGADNSPCSPAFAYCDSTAIVPEVKNGHYSQALLEICRKNRIDIAIPLIDPELEVLALQVKTFSEAGVMLLVSPEKTVQMSIIRANSSDQTSGLDKKCRKITSRKTTMHMRLKVVVAKPVSILLISFIAIYN